MTTVCYCPIFRISRRQDHERWREYFHCNRKMLLCMPDWRLPKNIGWFASSIERLRKYGTCGQLRPHALGHLLRRHRSESAKRSDRCHPKRTQYYDVDIHWSVSEDGQYLNVDIHKWTLWTATDENRTMKKYENVYAAGVHILCVHKLRGLYLGGIGADRNDE